MPFARILIAVDDQPVAERAATVGRGLAVALGAAVAVVTVIDPSMAYGGDAGVAAAEIAAEAEQDAERLLAGFRKGLSPAAQTFVGHGQPAVEIVRVAREWSADLVVVGSHGRAGLERGLLGSVADRVLRHASCPVLMVRPPP